MKNYFGSIGIVNVSSSNTEDAELGVSQGLMFCTFASCIIQANKAVTLSSMT